MYACTDYIDIVCSALDTWLHNERTQHGTYSDWSRANEDMELRMLPEIEVLYTELHTIGSQCTHNT